MSNANEPDQINNGALAMVIALVTFATLAIALYVTSLVREETRQVGAQRADAQDRSARSLRAEQMAELNRSPTWIDRDKGIVSMPIDSAMQWVVESVRSNPEKLSPGVALGMGGASAKDVEIAEEAEKSGSGQGEKARQEAESSPSKESSQDQKTEAGVEEGKGAKKATNNGKGASKTEAPASGSQDSGVSSTAPPKRPKSSPKSGRPTQPAKSPQSPESKPAPTTP